MMDLDRRRAALLAILAPLAGSAARSEPSTPDPVDHIAMLVYPGMTALDLVGPQHMFASMPGAKVHLVGKTLTPVTSDTDVTITPTATFQTCPRDVTVLFAPGGTGGTFAAMEDAATRAFMADRGARAKYVTSVSTGSLILAASGLLTGYEAACHWAARDCLADFGAIPAAQRVVRDRNRITGAGVTAGLDFGLAMVAELRGDDHARQVQLLSEYDPQPPFDAGSADAVSPALLAAMTGMLAPQTARARAIARALGRTV
jgi:transcriptional regulator GlxA family with amidase domain